MLRFCNSYPRRIFVAISFMDTEFCGGEGGDWRNRGWWTVDPGACVQVHSGIVSNVNRFWYYFADADDGTRWSGDFPTYVMDPEPSTSATACRRRRCSATASASSTSATATTSR